MVQLSLFFLYNFEGHLLVEPISADLERNLAEIGQMSPIVRMFLRDKEYDTEAVDEGGIRPHWQSKV